MAADDWAFIIGFLAGISAGVIGMILIATSDRGFQILRRYVYDTDDIDFREMADPPDEGIDQLLYKPKGSPASISRNAITRQNRKPGN